MLKLVSVSALIVALGAGSAFAGSSASAASKNTKAVMAGVNQAGYHGSSRVADVKITEFTSSSATGSIPKR